MKMIGIPEIVLKHVCYLDLDEGLSPTSNYKFRHQILIDREYNTYIVPCTVVDSINDKVKLISQSSVPSTPVHMGGLQFIKMKTNGRVLSYIFIKAIQEIYQTHGLDKIKLSRNIKSKNFNYIFKLESYAMLNGGTNISPEVQNALETKVRNIMFNTRARNWATITATLPSAGIKVLKKSPHDIKSHEIAKVYAQPIRHIFNLFNEIRINSYGLTPAALDLTIKASNSDMYVSSSVMDQTDTFELRLGSLIGNL